MTFLTKHEKPLASSAGISKVRKASRPVLEALENRCLMSGTLTLSNPYNLPNNSRLIFNTIANPNATVPNSVHNISTLVLKNSGAATLTINSISTSGPYELIDSSGNATSNYAGTTIAPGATLTITVKFTQTTLPAHSVNETNYTTNPNGGAEIDGSLVISSSDTTTPTKTVALAGYWQNASENNNEPNLTTIVNKILGYDTQIAANPAQVDLTEGGGSTPTYYGSEVVSNSWAAADPTKPISIQDLAEFHTEGNVVHTYWYNDTGNYTTNPTSHLLFTSVVSEGQTLLPHNNNLNTLAGAAFTPNGNFGFRVDNEYSTDAINANSVNNNGSSGGHHFRFYPLVDSNGVRVANTWIVAMDYAVLQTENYDFQDNVFVVSNMRPAGSPPAPTALAATSGATPTLTWTEPTYANSVTYTVSRATSANGTYTQLATGLTSPSYTDNNAPGGLGLYYSVTATDGVSGGVSTAATVMTNTPGGPVAVADTSSAFAGVADTIQVLNNDTDSTGAINPASVIVGTAAVHGITSVDTTTGAVIYTPTAGFSGNDTFTYTVADNNGAISSAATVTIAVTNEQSGTPTAAAVSTETLENTAVTIPVLADSQASGNSTQTLSSTIVGSLPAHGTTTLNSDGSITYTPKASFVGSDSFTYQVVSSSGVTSSPATVNLNVGVALTPQVKGSAKTLNYVDSSGAHVTLALTRGTVAVYFTGNGTVGAVAKNGTVAVSGATLVTDVVMSNTTAASTLNITTQHNLGPITIQGIEDTGTVGTINAKTTKLQGNLTLGGVKNLTFGSVTATQYNGASLMSIGSGSSTVSLTAGAISDSTLNSAVNIHSLNVTSWTNTQNGTIGINAPSLTSLTTKGEFDPSLTLSGTGANTLGSAVIGGSLGTGFWSISGPVRSVVIGTAGTNWGALFASSVQSITVRKSGLTDDISAGSIGSLTVTGNLSGNITAASAKSVRVTGAVTGAALNFTAGVSRTPALTTLSVGGAITNSTITTSGNINSIVAGSLIGSDVLVDTTSTDAVTTTSGNIGGGTLSSLKLTGHGVTFSNSSVIADVISSVSLGQVDASTTSDEGVAVHLIKSATIGIDGGVVHVPAADLVTESALTSYLSSKQLTFGTFKIVIV